MTFESSSSTMKLGRDQQLRRVLRQVIERRAHGEELSDREVVQQYPGLMPELELELDKLRCIDLAIRRADSEQYSRVWDRLNAGSSKAGGDRDGGDSAATEPAVDSVLSTIGRYHLRELLGQGGFGQVFLAWDTELARYVAIKIPHRHRLSGVGSITHFLAEARALAALDHPNIVPVYDVGRTPDDRCYVVSKWIQGVDLATRLRESRVNSWEATQILLQVAESLDYAHRRGFVHRDIKPANILLDEEGHPHLVDFGGLIQDIGSRADPLFVATPPYMSPEQASGETHRIDGRSDLFSLGAVFYEMLTGQRPFEADTREELCQRIIAADVRAPSLISDSVPAELERICMKALAKRAADRYSTASDLADDLRHFLTVEKTDRSMASSVNLPESEPDVESRSRIVPKGLRAFDAYDADFFLELLPGPRDRHGLPESIRQWKARIEETTAEQTFSVGLLYGTSGCGKSSLVRAGLLPRLAGHVHSLYLEATPDETEQLLLGRIANRFPALDRLDDLSQCLAQIRCGAAIAPHEKLLLVIDQFEQWLHGKDTESRRTLVQALRQCDGSRVQCLLLVRDDFWLAISRFMDELEVELVQGRNTALVDLFDAQHARHVLAEFGRSFSRLPHNLAEMRPAQARFLDSAIESLSEPGEGKVISVRLALFAEMVKSRPWIPATLDELGGAEGVGVTFLDEMFCARTANPQNRYHERGARAVLEALLPDPTSNIKGHVRSYPDLLDISGYGQHPRAFKELMRILDSETRLLTPTDVATNDLRVQQGLPPIRYYQLTHDYLVPSLRKWLTSKQKLTPSGRAELRLAERAQLWNARPEGRQLPSLWEWLAIRLLTRPANWSEPQRRMMKAAIRRQTVLAFATCSVLLAFLTLGGEVTSAARDSIRWFRASTAPVWLAFGREESLLPLLKYEADPSLRTKLIHRLQSLFIEPDRFLDWQDVQSDVTIRRALILAVGQSAESDQLPTSSAVETRRTAARRILIQRLADLYRTDVDPGIHAAAEWSLNAVGQGDEIARIDQSLSSAAETGDRQWFVTPQGHTLVVIPAPVQYIMGSPGSELGRQANEPQRRVHLRNSFAIASKETTVDQFHRFAREHLNLLRHSPELSSERGPLMAVNWYHAVAYCNWLSREAGIPQSQWCYLPNEQGHYAAGMKVLPLSSETRGYRLPTEAEWEYACRAGTTTARFFGGDDAYLPSYVATFIARDNSRLGVGRLKPNDMGLFDMLGNVAEWCHDAYSVNLEPSISLETADDLEVISDGSERVVRGGSIMDSPDQIRSAARSHQAAGSISMQVGFRIARNYP